MPKLASAVTIPSHARCSHSGGGMAQASLDDDDTWDDDFQTPHTPVCRIVWREDDGCGELVDGRVESSRESPGWQTGYQVDIGEEEATLETIDPTWRTTHWLQLVVQGISDDEVPWYELVIPLMVGSEGAALSLAKCLFLVWRWSIKVLGWDICPPALTALNIGQFMTKEEVSEGVDESLWFVGYSHTLQQVGEVAHGWKWEWPVGKMPEVRVSPLVHVFWEETGIDLTMTCIKLCWELPPRSIFRRRERGPVAYAITFLDELAIRVPSLNAWDQFIWLPAVAMPQALMEVEKYRYCHGQAIDLGPIMPVMQFRVTDKVRTYLCVARALVFEGSILAYNPTRDEVEWVPACGLANDLTWAEEKSAMAQANYMPCIPQEAAQIARLGTCHLMSWPVDSSTLEKEEEEQEEGEEWEEVDPELPSTDAELKQGEEEGELEPSR